MGKAVTNNDSQISYLKNRLEMFIEVIDHLDPEHADLEDIDRLIQMLDDMEVKVEQFKKDESTVE
ncbi:SE1561 family protein [Bacillus salitolerans]|uniref:SE1561 family protein n=1 Tax=Bacillus salitolerans TaxID=1437434 RepID=A0ABW4LV48_9BACI